MSWKSTNWKIKAQKIVNFNSIITLIKQKAIFLVFALLIKILSKEFNSSEKKK